MFVFGMASALVDLDSGVRTMHARSDGRGGSRGVDDWIVTVPYQTPSSRLIMLHPHLLIVI